VRVTTMPPVAAATAGAVCISSSAVLMKLASTASPSVVALGRCAFALPVLGVLALREHRRSRGTAPMPRRNRWLARLAGVALVLTGVVVAVTGRAPEADRAPEAGYSRRRTRIIRHASAASTDTSPSKSP
jgi:drug/metabolite transporter (DMT)-like permease